MHPVRHHCIDGRQPACCLNINADLIRIHYCYTHVPSLLRRVDSSLELWTEQRCALTIRKFQSLHSRHLPRTKNTVNILGVEFDDPACYSDLLPNGIVDFVL